MKNWVEFKTAQDVAAAAADTIQESARFAIQQRGEFKLVLAGGTSPMACYQILASRDLEWDKWKLFYGDERCLPLDDAERNHQLVAASGLTRLINKNFIVPAEMGSINGAESYQQQLAGQLPFDLVLLGMGEDGHTASLFPGQEWKSVNESQLTLAVHDAPKAPPERISMTLTALQSCMQMLVLVSGQSKRDAVTRWRDGTPLPVAEVTDIEQATVFIEAGLMN